MANQDQPMPLPFFFIGRALTDERKQIFMKRKYPPLCAELGREDTRNIWYSRDHIAKLLAEIDHAGGSGLRVYLGAYEKGHEYDGQLCLVMNSTREKNVNGITSQVDVHLEDEPDFAERSQAPRGKSTEKLFGGQQIKDFNFGSPCPPRCN